jgi:hypothetical protein
MRGLRVAVQRRKDSAATITLPQHQTQRIPPTAFDCAPTMKDLKEIFPRASKSFLESNPGTMSQPADQTKATVNVAKKRGQMNKTEREFSFILEAMKRKGEILRYDYEGITLNFAGVRYTPDFVVFPPAIAVSGQVKFIEVKGAFVKGKFERAIERFRHAKTYWPQFVFEMWQKKGDWKRIL